MGKASHGSGSSGCEKVGAVPVRRAAQPPSRPYVALAEHLHSGLGIGTGFLRTTYLIETISYQFHSGMMSPPHDELQKLGFRVRARA